MMSNGLSPAINHSVLYLRFLSCSPSFSLFFSICVSRRVIAFSASTGSLRTALTYRIIRNAQKNSPEAEASGLNQLYIYACSIGRVLVSTILTSHTAPCMTVGSTMASRQ